MEVSELTRTLQVSQPTVPLSPVIVMVSGSVASIFHTEEIGMSCRS